MLSNKKDKIFSRSLEQADKSDMLFKHGCVATCGGKIIACGHNFHNSSSHPFQKDQCSCHAEMDVLRKIWYKNQHKKQKLRRIMRKTTLYISRISASQNSASSAPCAECLSTIQKYNIKKLIFNLNDEYHEYRSQDYTTNHYSFGYLYVNHQ